MSNPSDGDEPFLTRWSRRKRTAVADAASDVAVAAEPADPATSGLVGEADGDLGTPASGAGADQIDLSLLPKVEDLDANSDIRAFLDARVPAVLRNAALARMWTLDPTIRDFIEVAENQWNWNIPGGAPFYEEIAGSPEIAESIVQGGGSVLRSVLADEADEAAAYTLVEHDGAGGSTADHVAPQATGNGAVRQTAGPDHSIRGPLHSLQATTLPDDLPAPAIDVAMQKLAVDSESEAVVQRRHGGALPA